MKKVLVTGSNGMLGQDLLQILKNEGLRVIKTTSKDMDITDFNQVQTVLEAQNPDYIVHAAGYTDVDGAETDEEKAFLINQKGSEIVAQVSGKMGIPVFYISTDYVFDGTKNSPYKPDDPTNPLSIYGKSKLAGENAVKENHPKHYIMRTSWLYGLNGKNFVETMITLGQKNKELKVVDDQTGCPTWTVELSKVIYKFIKENKPHGTYHVCGSGSTSWFGFACKIFEFMDMDVKVIPVNTETFPRPAKRPLNSVMDNDNLCLDWKESLKNYIEIRKNIN